MSNGINVFDLEGEDLADFLAKAVSDGTFSDVLDALKSDQAGQEAPASLISVASGQIWANMVDDFIETAYPVLQSAMARPFSYESTGAFHTLEDLGPIQDSEVFGVYTELVFATFDLGVVDSVVYLARSHARKDVGMAPTAFTGGDASGGLPGGQLQLTVSGSNILIQIKTSVIGTVKGSYTRNFSKLTGIV